EAYQAREDFITTRISFAILGKLHAGEGKVVTETVRPGRTIELSHSSCYAQGHAVLGGRTWKGRASDTYRVATLHDPQLHPVDPAEPWNQVALRWPGGFIRSLECRVFEDHAPGHGRAWITTDIDVIEGEKPSPFVKLVGLTDTANGIAPIAE